MDGRRRCDRDHVASRGAGAIACRPAASQSQHRHVYVDLEEPAPRRRARTADASAGAPGELRAGYPLAPPPVRAPAQSTASPPVAGGVNPEEQHFDETRAVRVSGRDATGRMWNARIYGPYPQPGEGTIGDAALHDLGATRGGCDDVQGLAALQRRLDAHYRRE
jgi:hypothetical protein